METTVKATLQLWVRGARVPDLVELLELVKAELQGRKITLQFSLDDRTPDGGPRR
ncbi:MAG: hypothetical protein L0191_02100 [Acidobacteria bacterium]|nr:hypothetical protein [Acidobacteriota bacterium]